MRPPSKCNACNGVSCVLETRSYADRSRRRRKCLTCGARWSTLELAIPHGYTVVILPAKELHELGEQLAGIVTALRPAQAMLNALTGSLVAVDAAEASSEVEVA